MQAQLLGVTSIDGGQSLDHNGLGLISGSLRWSWFLAQADRGSSR
jgi:hypothetical protein